MRQGFWNFRQIGGVQVRQVAPSSRKRARVEFWVGSGIVFITDQQGQPAGTGIPVTPARPLVIEKVTHGDLTHHAWYASSLTGDPDVGALDIEETDQDVS